MPDNNGSCGRAAYFVSKTTGGALKTEELTTQTKINKRKIVGELVFGNIKKAIDLEVERMIGSVFQVDDVG